MPNKTVKMKRDALNDQIAILQDEQIQWIKIGLSFKRSKDYVGDIASAMPLLEELNNQKPYEDGDYPIITGCGEHGWRIEVWFGHHDGDAIQFAILAKTLMLAIALAWYQWKTGIIVELED